VLKTLQMLLFLFSSWFCACMLFLFFSCFCFSTISVFELLWVFQLFVRCFWTVLLWLCLLVYNCVSIGLFCNRCACCCSDSCSGHCSCWFTGKEAEITNMYVKKTLCKTTELYCSVLLLYSTVITTDSTVISTVFTIALYCTVLSCIVLYCIVLYCIVWSCIVLHFLL